MKEKKKKRKSWMNRIVAFLTTVCVSCVTFVVPAFAEDISESSSFQYISTWTDSSKKVFSDILDVTFDSDDVITFLGLGNEYTDSDGNSGFSNDGIYFVSQEPFNIVGHEQMVENDAEGVWNVRDFPGSGSLKETIGWYVLYIPWGWYCHFNAQYSGKYVLVNTTSNDLATIADKYCLGEDISDYVVESDLTGQLDTDIDSIGYLKDVKVNVLGVEGKEYFAITYGSLTTSDYDLANSNIQYQLRSRYYTSAGLCDLDTITDIESLPANSYKLTFAKEELNAPIQQCIFDNIIYPVAGNDEPNFFEDRAIFQVLHSSDAFSYVEIYMRPTGFVNNQECVGGWTKIHIELAQDGSYTTDTYLISTGTNDSYQIIAGLDDEWNDVTPPSKNNPDYGTGSTIDSALNNIPSVDNAFSFDLSGVDDIGSYFENLLKSLIQSIGTVPVMIKTCFSFLPNEIILFLGGGLVLIVILRIFGR